VKFLFFYTLFEYAAEILEIDPSNHIWMMQLCLSDIAELSSLIISSLISWEAGTSFSSNLLSAAVPLIPFRFVTKEIIDLKSIPFLLHILQ
jgi:VIT1/CCC1 family predicted Fe2+/Mn2+ transporter